MSSGQLLSIVELRQKYPGSRYEAWEAILTANKLQWWTVNGRRIVFTRETFEAACTIYEAQRPDFERRPRQYKRRQPAGHSTT